MRALTLYKKAESASTSSYLVCVYSTVRLSLLKFSKLMKRYMLKVMDCTLSTWYRSVGCFEHRATVRVGNAQQRTNLGVSAIIGLREEEDEEGWEGASWHQCTVLCIIMRFAGWQVKTWPYDGLSDNNDTELVASSQTLFLYTYTNCYENTNYYYYYYDLSISSEFNMPFALL